MEQAPEEEQSSEDLDFKVFKREGVTPPNDSSYSSSVEDDSEVGNGSESGEEIEHL
ncbi:MAG: hypothetical protein LBB38_02755 [Puniceicoccales bacterium]|nr:hypothetical protein [Puniceicoccales bacterium]